jgi:hypothetical protein
MSDRPCQKLQGGRLVGKNDKILAWSKPKTSPTTLTQEEFAALPNNLKIREIFYSSKREQGTGNGEQGLHMMWALNPHQCVPLIYMCHINSVGDSDPRILLRREQGTVRSSLFPVPCSPLPSC